MLYIDLIESVEDKFLFDDYFERKLQQKKREKKYKIK